MPWSTPHWLYCSPHKAMTYQELALLMPCQDNTLVGVLSRPDKSHDVGLVIIVGGPQYRAGSHRQFVLLARRMAEAGYPVLRFDYRGMGDSEGEPRSFETIDQDIATAIDALQRACPEVRRVVLWGLCDGASAALLYCGARRDARIVGLCLLNPWVRSEATLARTHLKHHYGARLLQGDFWMKVVSGKFSLKESLDGLWSSYQASRSRSLNHTSSSQFQGRMISALNSFSGRVLLVLSENDYTAKEFLEVTKSVKAWSGLMQRADLQRVDIAGADHTLSRRQWRVAAEQALLNWMETMKV